MNLSSPFFVTLILSGLSLVAGGWAMLMFPPKSINALYGYRTRRSQSSQEAWDFSQPFAARLMLRNGAALSLISLVGCFVSMGPNVEVWAALSLGISACLMVCSSTENALVRFESTS